jgi:hypothetical protein
LATRFPGNGSFCEELSKDPAWLQISGGKWSAKPTFEAYSHSREIQEVLQQYSADGKNPSKQHKEADDIRSSLRVKLNELLGEFSIILLFNQNSFNDE